MPISFILHFKFELRPKKKAVQRLVLAWLLLLGLLGLLVGPEADDCPNRPVTSSSDTKPASYLLIGTIKFTSLGSTVYLGTETKRFNNSQSSSSSSHPRSSRMSNPPNFASFTCTSIHRAARFLSRRTRVHQQLLIMIGSIKV